MSIVDRVKTAIGMDKKEESESIKENVNTKEERKVLLKFEQWNQESTSGDRRELEETWDNEYKMYVGDQWDTTLALRTTKAKKKRYNSVDNFIFPAIYNMHSALVPTQPDCIIEDTSSDAMDKETAQKLTDLVKFIRYKNKFSHKYKKASLQFLKHGPFIWMVVWDNNWIGGSGPDRWIGEVRHIAVKKSEFFPDPAIRDLDEDLQECGYILRKRRKKIDYFKDLWPDKSYFVQSDEEGANDEGAEGMNPEMAELIEGWHKGTPLYISDEWKQHFKQKAEEALAQGLQYKAKEYEDKSEGRLKGVHVGYGTRDVLLDYIPYIYDDGLYPFVFGTLYEDDENPLGIGEIRNVMMPQILHNKADEIEIEAMAKEGLGGAYYQKGSITKTQLDAIEANNGKGGVFLEVNDLAGIKDRTGAKVPAVVTEYKEHKQRMIETITQNTPVTQGLNQGGVTAARAIEQLGARADTKNHGKNEVLEDMLVEITQMELRRIAQFYTEDRTYRILGGSKQQQMMQQQGMQPPQQMMQGQQPQMGMPQQPMMNQQMPLEQQQPMGQPLTFNRSMMVKQWEREPGNMEEYIPEWDVRVKLQNEKPTDRNYYANMALALRKDGLIDVESVWHTLEEGTFPPKEEILQRLSQEQQAAQQAQMAQQVQGAQIQDSMMQQKQQEKDNQQKEADIQNKVTSFKKVMDRLGLSADEQNTVLEAFKKWPEDKQMTFLEAGDKVQEQTLQALLGQ